MITIEQGTEGTNIVLKGRLSSVSVYTFNSEIKRMLEEKGIPKAVYIDIKDVVYMNASVLRAVYYLTRFMHSKKVPCSFYGNEGITEDFLNLSGLTFVVPFITLNNT